MMVAVAVVAVLVLGFSQVLSSTQRVVVGGQEIIRTNAEGAAIAQLIRADLSHLSRDGFLAVRSADASGTHDRLVFTAVGTYQNKQINAGDPSLVSNAALIDWGLTSDGKLYRRLRVLGAASDGADYLSATLAEYKKDPPTSADLDAMAALDEPTIPLPPTTLAQVKTQLWPLVTERGIRFEVGYSPAGAAPGDDWTAVQGTTWTIWPGSDPWPEALSVAFEIGEGDSGQSYDVVVRLNN
jgi:hypothetical protein